MSTDKKVSIIIPAYNYGKYLHECLQSLFAQTHENWEAIIVDDGSTDSTESISGSLVALDKRRIKYFRIANQGVSNARNFGVQNSSGEFILPLDADDLLNPDAAAEFVAAIEQSDKNGFAYCALENFNALPGESNVWTPGIFSRKSISNENPAACTSLWRKSLWEKGVKYRNFIFEDWDLWLQIVNLGYDGVYIPKPLFKYRIHPHGRHTLNKNRYMQAKMQESISFPALYTEGFSNWSKNGLKNAPESINLPTVAIIIDKNLDNFSIEKAALSQMVNEFLKRKHLVAIYDGTNLPLDQQDGIVALSFPENNYKALCDSLHSMGKELIVLSSQNEELSLILKKLNNVSSIINIKKDFDTHADINITGKGAGFLADARSSRFSIAKEISNVEVLVESMLKASAENGKFILALENKFYEKLISISRTSHAEIESLRFSKSHTFVISYFTNDFETLSKLVTNIRELKGFRENEIIVSSPKSFSQNLDLQQLAQEHDVCLCFLPEEQVYSRAKLFNNAAKQVSTDFVSFVDSNVIISPKYSNYLELYLGELGRSNIFKVRTRKLSFKETFESSETEELLINKSIVDEEKEISALSMQKNIFLELGMFNEKYLMKGYEFTEICEKAKSSQIRSAWLPEDTLALYWNLEIAPQKVIDYNKSLLDSFYAGHHSEVLEISDFGFLSSYDEHAYISEHLKQLPFIEKNNLLLSWGNHLLANSQSDNAISVLKDFLILNEGSVEGMLQLSKAYVTKGNIAKAGHYALLAKRIDAANEEADKIIQAIKEVLN